MCLRVKRVNARIMHVKLLMWQGGLNEDVQDTIWDEMLLLYELKGRDLYVLGRDLIVIWGNMLRDIRVYLMDLNMV